MADLHMASDNWTPARTCDRPDRDIKGLLGEAPLWDRFWDNPGLSAPQRALMKEFRIRATKDLQTLSPVLDYGLIHAALGPSNVMLSD